MGASGTNAQILIRENNDTADPVLGLTRAQNDELKRAAKLAGAPLGVLAGKLHDALQPVIDNWLANATTPPLDQPDFSDDVELRHETDDGMSIECGRDLEPIIRAALKARDFKPAGLLQALPGTATISERVRFAVTGGSVFDALVATTEAALKNQGHTIRREATTSSDERHVTLRLPTKPLIKLTESGAPDLS